MNRNAGILFCLIIVACFSLAVLAGCEGIVIPTAPPQSTEVLAPTPSPSPSEAVGSATPQDTLSPSPAATDTQGPSPTASPDVTPTPTPDVTTPADSASPEPTDTPVPSPTPTPTPTPTPKPSLEPSHDGDSPAVAVVKYYGRTSPVWLPDGLGLNLKYTKYWNNTAPLNYLDYFVFSRTGTVRALPDTKAKALETERATGRLALLAQVKGADGKSVWYRVRTTKGAVGYIVSTAGWPDSFKVDEAFAQVKKLQAVANQPNTTRISNYNNVHGLPPAFPGKKSQDNYANLRDQSAPAYLAADLKSSFRYAPDGTLGQVLGTSGTFSKVYFPGWDEVRYVPTKYLLKSEAIKTLTQAIVVNRNLKNQNIIVFELINGKWNIVSMCFVSTGANAGPHKPTPLGDFFTQKHKGRNGLGEFYFFPDGTPESDANGNQKFEGYAPWAIRFTGGAYLHGMPIGVSYDPVTNLIIPTKRTSEVYGNFIGVYPASHMCVRNYTSHAKFMYDWVKDGQAAVIVIQ